MLGADRRPRRSYLPVAGVPWRQALGRVEGIAALSSLAAACGRDSPAKGVGALAVRAESLIAIEAARLAQCSKLQVSTYTRTALVALRGRLTHVRSAIATARTDVPTRSASRGKGRSAYARLNRRLASVAETGASSPVRQELPDAGRHQPLSRRSVLHHSSCQNFTVANPPL